MYLYIHTLIRWLQDISVAACGGLNPSMSPFPLRGTWTREASIHQFPLPISPSLLLSITSALLPPLLLSPTSSNFSCTFHEADFPPPPPPPPLAFFSVSSSHEAFFLKCAVLIKLIPPHPLFSRNLPIDIILLTLPTSLSTLFPPYHLDNFW